MDKELVQKEIEIILQDSITKVGKILDEKNEETKEALENAMGYQTATQNEALIVAAQKKDVFKSKSATSVRSMTQRFLSPNRVPQNSRAPPAPGHDELYYFPNQKTAGEMVTELKEKLHRISQANLALESKVAARKSPRTCKCSAKQLSAIKSGKQLSYKPLKEPLETVEFLNRPRDPVAFSFLPEEAVAKPADPEKKFFFGQESQTAEQLTDSTQSVMNIIDNVHKTAEQLLNDTEKVLEKLEIKKEVFEDTYQVDRNVVQLPVSTLIKEAVFGFAPEEELRELERQAKKLQENKPDPMVEVLEDPSDEVNKKIFESTLLPQFFDTQPKPHDPYEFEFSPETGALTFKKRASSQQEELTKKTEVKKDHSGSDSLLDDKIEAISQKLKLRRAEATEDLTAGIEKICGSGGDRSEVQSPMPCVSVDANTARFVDKKFREAKEKREKLAGKTEKLAEKLKEKESKPKKVKEKKSWLRSMGSLGSLGSLTKLYGKVDKKSSATESKQDEEDDDGFINLPEVPSSTLGEVSSDAWIDENVEFYACAVPSVHIQSPLGKASETMQNPNEPSTTGQIKSKESKMVKVKSFVKSLFRSNKD